MALTTIATFSKAEEAHLFRIRLEAVGIEAFVFDEHLVQMDWYLSNAVGGVRVQIAEEDMAEAREFLAADVPQPCPEAEDVMCPKCGSHATAPDEWPRRAAFLALLFLHFPLLVSWRSWRCSACDEVFKLAKPHQSRVG